MNKKVMIQVDEQIEKTLYAYIVLPYVLKLFKKDIQTFENGPFSANVPYLDKLDTAIQSAQDDLNAVKQTIYKQYHMKVRYLGKKNDIIRYDWQTRDDSGDVRFTPDQLYELTKDMMGLYLYGMLAKEVIPSNRAWY
ncbi:hypothetical protein GH741_01380 [Aquibacillus halophilus]|uniref:Uncharacterized protein n=1 Tax=Aquibacillus halophilus TaxID=930132 RepID=A0A6A8D6F6_9BACI|nr:hypothetical protein [Aquibacillus halophilus]MRH41323.1 hypothetical protein [Aquibacillus halophilus]